MSPQATEFDLDGFVNAMKTWDVDGILAHFSDDVEFRDPAVPRTIRGKEILREMMAQPAVEDMDVEPVMVAREGDVVAALLKLTATFTDDFEIAGVTFPTSGKTLDDHRAVFLRIDDAGKIKEFTRMKDTWITMQQLGVSEEDVRRVVDALGAMPAQP